MAYLFAIGLSAGIIAGDYTFNIIDSLSKVVYINNR